MKPHTAILVLLLTPVLFAGSTSTDWPQFRGPTGQGIAEDADPPLHWGPTQNITWKTNIPGAGWSSPVLYKDRIYLTTALTDDEGNPTSLRTLSIDAATGDIIWNSPVFTRKGKQHKHDKNSHASPTPVAEDDRIYVHFGHMGTACLDTEGNVVWRQTGLAYDPYHGNGSSPILAGDKLIFSCDAASDPFVVALNKATGKVAWRVKRPKTKAGNKFSFCTPLLINENDRPAVISPGSGIVSAYDPDDGSELWRVLYGSGFSVIPRPVHGRGMVYIGTGFGKANVYAIRTGGTGDVTDSHMAWQTDRHAPLTPSMLLAGDELYYFSDSGRATCVDARTGEQHWQERLSGKISASPTLANGRIYITTEKGNTHVIKAATEFEQLAENDLKEKTFASPALASRTIFIRTESNLYRIEEQE